MKSSDHIGVAMAASAVIHFGVYPWVFAYVKHHYSESGFIVPLFASLIALGIITWILLAAVIKVWLD